MAFGGYNYGGYPANGGYYPPPMPDQLAQLRGAQMPPMQQPMMGQPVMNQPVPMNNQPVQTMPQPMQQPQQTQQPAMTGPFYVNGDAGARGYIVAPNQTVMNMVNSGAISQSQLNQAQQMARQFQQMMGRIK